VKIAGEWLLGPLRFFDGNRFHVQEFHVAPGGVRFRASAPFATQPLTESSRSRRHWSRRGPRATGTPGPWECDGWDTAEAHLAAFRFFRMLELFVLGIPNAAGSLRLGKPGIRVWSEVKSIGL